jgi:uncharacterized protein YyaL (SSP411 family)
MCLCLLLLSACKTPHAGTARGEGESENEAKPSAVIARVGDPALPGIEHVDAALQQRLIQAAHDSSIARTKHLLPDGRPRYTNRLALSTSPYLRQHAHNPVNWQPWGPEALERAKREGRPIFLSVGYATCHWCHVMEEESFEDEEVAAFLNRHFICIKVDREERPDVDAVYMRALVSLRGQGGWPMTLVLTPEAAPFYAATYLPPRDSAQRGQGLLTVLPKLVERFVREPARVVERAKGIVSSLALEAKPKARGTLPDESVVRAQTAMVLASVDREHGGFHGAPKFPQAPSLELLLRTARSGDRAALAALQKTLEAMALGGIFDALGGGFHRYTVDARFRLPHFEKMLYDNALLASVYTDAYALTGDSLFAETARCTLDAMLRELGSPEGAFYAATDADSADEAGRRSEGYFFTFSRRELEASLPPPMLKLAEASFLLQAHTDENRLVLTPERRDEVIARALGMPLVRFEAQRERLRARLMALREAKTPPTVDTKLLSGWNGLSIRALARAGFTLDEPTYIARAVRAAEHVERSLRDPQGRLLHSDGMPRTRAFLDDHAGMIAGLLALFEVTLDLRFLDRALGLQAELNRDYRAPQGAYHRSAADAEALLYRDVPDTDGAEPSGNALSAHNLLRLAQLTGRADFWERATGLLEGLRERLGQGPVPMLAAAASDLLSYPFEIVIVLASGATTRDPLTPRVRGTYLPGSVVLRGTGDELKAVASRIAWVADKRAIDGRTTAYVCQRGSCRLPTRDPGLLADQLGSPRAAAAPARDASTRGSDP